MFKRYWPVLLCVQLGLILGYISYFARPMSVSKAAEMQQQAWAAFVTKTIPPDADFILPAISTRVLMPALIAVTAWISGMSWDIAFTILRLITAIIALIVFYWFLRRQFFQSLSVTGLLFLAATLPLTFNNHYEIPTDFPELITFTLGMACILERRIWLLCLVTAVGSLNRETSCFLPLIFLFVCWKWPLTISFILQITAVGFSWLIPLALLRYRMNIGWRGQYGHSLSHNLAGLSRFFENLNPYNNYLFYGYLFGLLWVVPFIFRRSLPEDYRRASLAIPIMLAVYLFAGGFMDEPREIITFYPLLVPVGLYALSSER